MALQHLELTLQLAIEVAQVLPTNRPTAPEV